MIANIIELEHEAMKAALGKEKAMIVLLDFKAAFPSVSQEFMRTCLGALGIPRCALNVVGTIYHQGCCMIAQSQDMFEGFNIGAGIRQGCPLSPLIFVTVMDLLLRFLGKELGDDVTIRAFADDIGLVLTNAEEQLPTFAALMERFGNISGMQINVKKTICIPLWTQNLEEAGKWVKKAVPSWSDMPIQGAATYLGHVLGPDKRANHLGRYPQTVCEKGHLNGNGANLDYTLPRGYLICSSCRWPDLQPRWPSRQRKSIAY